MSKIEEFKKNHKGIRKIGVFENDSGEVYLVYDYITAPDLFLVTGDNLDWEDAWQYDNKNKKLYQVFDLIDEENVEIIKIIAAHLTK